MKKGEVIAKVKVIPELGQLNSAQSRLRLAEINLKQSETDFGRTRKLFEDNLISREEFEKGEVSYKQALEEHENAKDALDIVREGITKKTASYSNTLIRSTIDGLILDVPVKAGNSVIMSNTFNDGTTIATVANSVPDTVMIRSGYSANAEIVLARSGDVLVVPESTIEFSGDTTFVWVMTDSVPQQKFIRREVQTGMSDGINIEIKTGITQNEKVRGAEKKDKK